MSVFIHPQAVVETDAVGDQTRIGAFAHILPDAVIGKNCNICDHTFIDNDVRVGDNVTVKSGVQLWEGTEVENGVFIGPNATFANDPLSPSKLQPGGQARTVLKQGASIGANATIPPGITVGRNAIVGDGSLVTANVPANAIVRGVPARIEGYTDDKRKKVPLRLPDDSGAAEVSELGVAGVKLYKIPLFEDLRGSLNYCQYPDHMPFVPRRFFIVHNVPSSKIHGEHAHKTLEQFFVCLRGRLAVNVDNGTETESIVLSSPRYGLYIPPMVWATQYDYSPDGMLLVLASDVYDEDEYIRNYDDYLAARKKQAGK